MTTISFNDFLSRKEYRLTEEETMYGEIFKKLLLVIIGGMIFGFTTVAIKSVSGIVGGNIVNAFIQF